MCAFLAWFAACGGTHKATAEAGSKVRGIEAAALPYRIVRVDGGREISMDELVGELAAAQAVCIGETHTSPHDHWAQLELFNRLSAQNAERGVTTALGMEMFQRPFQGVLDDYAAKRIDDAALLSRAGWKRRWGHDWNLYAPIVRMARDRNAAILGLNVSTELKDRARDVGVAGLSEAERGQVPEMVLDDAAHRAWWDSKMSAMGGVKGHSKEGVGDNSSGEPAGGKELPEGHPTLPEGHPKLPEGQSPELPEGHPEVAPAPHEGEPAEPVDATKLADQMYFVQVLWDETMADTAARWVRGDLHRQVVILAGNGHCHNSAIVGRMRRRGVQHVVSIHPLVDKGDGEVADLLAAPENDFLFIMTPP